MTATTVTRSAYPKTVDDLIPYARTLADQLGEVPSRNKLMKTFKVGPDKANALLDALTTTPTSTTPTNPTTPAKTAAPATVPAPSANAITVPAPVAAPTSSYRHRWSNLSWPLRLRTAPKASTRGAKAGAGSPQRVADAVADRRPVTWPVLILCLPAFVAIWGGWVEMGRLTGFGMVKLLPGIADSVELNTAITLPIGVEAYAAYALYVWLSGRAAGDARTFAKWSALVSLALGAAGQIAYHLMAAAGWTTAPWPITAAVGCIPVAVLGMGAALAHLMHHTR